MTREDLRQIILHEISQIAPETEGVAISDTEDLREALDLDSMDIFNLVVALSQRLGFDIPDADAARLTTLGSGTDYLQSRLAPR
ncbi:acyl carrier protein [Altererythrobacter confluentis]|uniref:Acyl carrier protein n=1 Tax=Allopontixanthobacter confluentis TaxID=1849021 RepID=A0A6L7GDC7_9SPHN|nr:acyl carrier protein [Allopontixanthobacter confluentis]MXP13204.1 acyl carrier protein [Allopontixanthobacter confluentis]